MDRPTAGKLHIQTGNIKCQSLKTPELLNKTKNQENICADANGKFEKQTRNEVQETNYGFNFRQGKTHLEVLITESTMLACRVYRKLH